MIILIVCIVNSLAFYDQVIAASGTINVTIKNTSGQGVGSIPGECIGTYRQESASGDIPLIEVEHYKFTSNSAGKTSISVQNVEKAEFQCILMISSKDYSGGNSGFKVSSGGSKSVSFTYLKGASSSTKVKSNSSNSSVTKSQTQTQSQEEVKIEYAPISKSNIPGGYSLSHDLKKLEMEQAKKVETFKVAHKESKNTIEWLEPLDLSSADLEEKFNKLDEYIQIDNKGKVFVNTEALPQLNKKARVTMANLNFYFREGEGAVITKDGEIVSEDLVSDIKYDSEAKTLVFTVSGFSEYELKPRLIVNECEEAIKEDKCTITGYTEDLDADLTLSISGDMGMEEELAINEKGEFEFDVELDRGQKIDVKLLSANLNGATETASWSTSREELIKSIYLIIGAAILVIIAIGSTGKLVWKKFSDKKR